MAAFNYKPGLGNAAAYQVSGVPYVTGGINASAADQVVYFPTVTSWVVVNSGTDNEAGGTRVAFSENGLHEGSRQSKYLFVTGSTPKMDLKITELWLAGGVNVQVIAGLTSILTEDIDESPLSPSGSNWSGSVNARVG